MKLIIQTDIAGSVIIIGNLIIGSTVSLLCVDTLGVLLGPVISGLFSLLCLWLRQRYGEQSRLDRLQIEQLKARIRELETQRQ